MPSTPELWKDLGQINTVDAGVGIDLQNDPKVVHLTNGNILYAWSSNANVGAGSEPGTDVIGKIYDSQGNLVKDEFKLNNFSTDDESDADIAALPGGGFVVVYVDDAGGDDTSLRLTRWDAGGTSGTSTSIVTDTTDADTYRNPSVAVSSDSSVLITWERVNPDGDADDTDVHVERAVYDATTATVGSSLTLFAGLEGTDQGISGNAVTALSNGNYALVYGNNNSSNDVIEARILNAAGVQIGGNIIVSNASIYVQDPHVVALTGGRFVVAYEISTADPTTNSGMRVKIYNNDGTFFGGPFTVTTTSAGNQTNGVVAALTDGGFVVAWVDEDTQDIHGQRYNATGFKVGIEFDIDTNFGNQPTTGLDIEGLEDGRFVVTWEEATFAASPLLLDVDVHSVIFDPRDFENTSAVYTDNQVIGTIGNDSIFISSTDENVFGHDGDDFFGFSSASDAGAGDVFDGGAGTDTIDVSTSGGTLDFQSATLTSIEKIDFIAGLDSETVILRADQVAAGQLSTVSEVTGNIESSDDTLRFIMGTDTDLDLSGFTFTSWESGVDSIEIIGDGDAETITGSSVDDIIEGGGGSDTIDGGAGDDTINQANDGTSNDIDGGADTDTLDLSASTIAWMADLNAGTGAAGATSLTISNIEELIGTDFADTLTGVAGSTIRGGDGADIIDGKFTSGATSNLFGDGGDDTFLVTGTDFTSNIDGGAGLHDVLDLSGADFGYTVDLDAGTTSEGGVIGTITGVEDVRGTNSGDSITGDGLANELSGNGGGDTINGEGGADNIDGDEGDDVINGGAGSDMIDGGANDAGGDTASYADATNDVSVYLQFTGIIVGGGQGADTLIDIENLTGGDFNDRLIGDAGNNVLTGGIGNDILKGKDGDDTFFGGDGDDRMTGGSGVDIMNGGAGSDIMFALAGDDILNGGADRDFVYGGRDSDTVHGDGGDDEVRGNLGNDMIFGDAGSDDLRGGGNNDMLDGGIDNDFLFGENGQDTLIGGAGSDSLSGGLGGGVGDGFQDTFVYSDTASGGGGFDRVKDFENGTDLIDLTSFSYTNFSQVNATSANGGADTRINFGSGDVLYIENFAIADLDASDVLL